MQMLESFDDSALSDDVVVLLADLAVKLVLVESVAELVIVDVVGADSTEPVLSSDCT